MRFMSMIYDSDLMDVEDRMRNSPYKLECSDYS